METPYVEVMGKVETNDSLTMETLFNMGWDIGKPFICGLNDFVIECTPPDMQSINDTIDATFDPRFSLYFNEK